MRGIILAGGSGTRLHPMTQVVSKQMLPIYDKPMIYYPLAVLMLAGIREILIISTPRDLPMFRALLGDGGAVGPALCLRRAAAAPTGSRRRSSSARTFSPASASALVLGDNLFYGHGLPQMLTRRPRSRGRARPCSPITSPIPSVTAWWRSTRAARRPRSRRSRQSPKSRWAVTGLYFYDERVVDIRRER